MLLRGGGSRRRILVERGLREEVPFHGPRAACGNKRNGMRACPMVRCVHVGDDGRRYRDDGLDHRAWHVCVWHDCREITIFRVTVPD